jgi:hypothetical protein
MTTSVFIEHFAVSGISILQVDRLTFIYDGSACLTLFQFANRLCCGCCLARLTRSCGRLAGWLLSEVGVVEQPANKRDITTVSTCFKRVASFWNVRSFGMFVFFRKKTVLNSLG